MTYIEPFMDMDYSPSDIDSHRRRLSRGAGSAGLGGSRIQQLCDAIPANATGPCHLVNETITLSLAVDNITRSLVLEGCQITMPPCTSEECLDEDYFVVVYGNLSLVSHSVMHLSSAVVLVTDSVFVDDTSAFTVSQHGPPNLERSSTGSNGVGGGSAGAGSVCPPRSAATGTAFATWKLRPFFFGGSTFTASGHAPVSGGGRLQIAAGNTFQLLGNVSADGTASDTPFLGGTGAGSIYIEANRLLTHTSGFISARGGSASGDRSGGEFQAPQLHPHKPISIRRGFSLCPFILVSLSLPLSLSQWFCVCLSVCLSY